MGDKEYLVPQSRHEKYEMRPEDQECTVSCGVFENMCFAEFSMLYEYTTDTSEHTCWHSLDKTEDGIHVCDNEKDVIQTLFKDKKVKLNGWRWGKKEKPNTKPVLPVPCELGYTRRNYNWITTDKCNPFIKYKRTLDGEEQELVLPQWIRLNNDRPMKLRSKPYILRMYSFPKDPLERQYSELVLFTPWRYEKSFFLNENQQKMLSSEDSEFAKKIQECYKNSEKEWERNRKKIYPFSNKVEEIREMMQNENFQRSRTIYDSINPQEEQENEEDKQDVEFPDDDDFPEEQDYSKKKKEQKRPLKPEKCVFKKMILPEEKNELFQAGRSLTYEQRVVFDKFIHYLQCIICARHGGDIEPIPPRIIVHGKDYFNISSFTYN